MQKQNCTATYIHFIFGQFLLKPILRKLNLKNKWFQKFNKIFAIHTNQSKDHCAAITKNISNYVSIILLFAKNSFFAKTTMIRDLPKIADLSCGHT